MKLDKCLKLTRDIKDVEEEIEELQAGVTAPRSQALTGMPRGGGLTNQNDNYMIKLERKETRLKKLKSKRELLWFEISNTLTEKNASEEHIKLLWYRFYNGLPWKKCCAIMREKYKDSHWNINKVFRVYRKMLEKLPID